MGEYIMLDGVQVKIGTCEDLRYCDFPTFVDWVAAGRTAHCLGNEQPLDYLRPGPNAYRFHFEGLGYDAPPTVTAPLGFLLGEWEHSKVTAVTYPADHRNRYEAGDPFVPYLTLTSPCPNGAFWIGKRPFTTDYVQIWAAKPMPVDGKIAELWTCIRCPWCNCIARLDADHAVTLVDSWNGDNPALAERILAGYADINREPTRPADLTGAGSILWARWQAAHLLGLQP